MQPLINHLVLEGVGPLDATVGMVSLPLPRDVAGGVSIAHPNAAMQPVGWWVRNEVPRRSLAVVVDSKGVPETLRLQQGKAAAPSQPSDGWSVNTRITREKLDFKPAKYSNVESLRGVPAEDCTTVEFELLLGYGGRTVSLQFGATNPMGEGAFYWQNVHVDRLWKHRSVEAMRVGGVIYNGDTYLWADVYLLLFSNGVAHAAAHFVNTKLHIEGYDFQGLPLIRLEAEDLSATDATLPADGARFELGSVRLNLSDAEALCSEECPATLRGAEGELFWRPFSRTFNPQLKDAPPLQWAPGFARTVRFQFSLSDAAPVIARYRVPAWWYAVSGEPWPGSYLPVHGRLAKVGELTSDHLRGKMQTGRFDAGSAAFGNDGFAGIGMMRNAYHTGRADLYSASLDYCYYWADLAIDHRDFTVHQWVGGWPWKTCAYSKFRDVLMGYLETGDPYLLDTVEMAADSYWAWFRSNWPRCTIGRDAFELGGWALLRRYLGSERARERTREFVRMIRSVLDSRESVGGQMGAGPHPGYLSSLYMTAIAMCSLLDVAEAEVEEGEHQAVAQMRPLFQRLHERWIRDDIEMFPSNYGKQTRATWGDFGEELFAGLSGRIYPQLARLGLGAGMVDVGLLKLSQTRLPSLEKWATEGRPGDNLINPLYHDALLLGARLTEAGVELSPLGDPTTWAPEQTVETPWGPLQVRTTVKSDEVTFSFSAAQQYEVEIEFNGGRTRTTSDGAAVFRILSAVSKSA